MNVGVALHSLRQQIKRLNQLAENGGCTDVDGEEELRIDVSVLDWLMNNILTEMTKTALIIGSSDVVEAIKEEIEKMPKSEVTDCDPEIDHLITSSSGELSTLVVISPRQRVLDVFNARTDPNESGGKHIPPEMCPVYVYCYKYLAAIDDRRNKVVYFLLSMRNEYLNNAASLFPWAKSVFSKLEWAGPRKDKS